MDINPRCPNCKTEDLILEPPSWNHEADNKIIILAYCLKCRANFELKADVTNYEFIESSFEYGDYPV